MSAIPVTKGDAYGNDFLLVPADRVSGDAPALARAMCHRENGLGADGLILYELRPDGASMRLWNADGSPAELSGNGLRCLAALVARSTQLTAGDGTTPTVNIETKAGLKTLELLSHDGLRYVFRAAMGQPANIRQARIPLQGEAIDAIVLSVGNPQCIVLGPLPDEARFQALGPALSTHAMFPEGTNVEFVEVEAPDRIRILIWERGVGPTSSSGTGASASAVAAAAHGGAARSLDVVAPGGTQRVEWLDDGIYLTGWAEIVSDGEWSSP